MDSAEEVNNRRILVLRECIEIAEKMLLERSAFKRLAYRHVVSGLYNITIDDDTMKFLFNINFSKDQVFPFTVGKGESALCCNDLKSIEHNVRRWMQIINLNDILNKKS